LQSYIFNTAHNSAIRLFFFSRALSLSLSLSSFLDTFLNLSHFPVLFTQTHTSETLIDIFLRRTIR